MTTLGCGSHTNTKHTDTCKSNKSAEAK